MPSGAVAPRMTLVTAGGVQTCPTVFGWGNFRKVGYLSLLFFNSFQVADRGDTWSVLNRWQLLLAPFYSKVENKERMEHPLGWHRWRVWWPQALGRSVACSPQTGFARVSLVFPSLSLSFPSLPPLPPSLLPYLPPFLPHFLLNFQELARMLENQRKIKKQNKNRESCQPNNMA